MALFDKEPEFLGEDSLDAPEKKPEEKKRTAADVLADPKLAESTKRQRIEYFNLPEVRRSMAIESAEKKEPYRDTPKKKPVN